MDECRSQDEAAGCSGPWQTSQVQVWEHRGTRQPLPDCSRLAEGPPWLQDGDQTQPEG